MTNGSKKISKKQIAIKKVNGLKAATAGLSCALAITLAGMGSYIGLEFDSVSAAFKGEPRYSQAQVDSSVQNGYDSGYQEAMKYDYFRVGETLQSLYFNTDLDVPAVTAILDSLDWENCPIKATPENNPDMAGLEGAEWDTMYLMSSYTPPANYEEYVNFNKENGHSSKEKDYFQIVVWRQVLPAGINPEYPDGTTSYIICFHGSAGIWTQYELGHEKPVGCLTASKIKYGTRKANSNLNM